MANGREVSLDDGATVADLLRVLELERRVSVVEHNGQPVAPSQFAGHPLADGDRVELVRAAAGG